MNSDELALPGIISKMKSTQTTFYIVRHGETEWNLAKLLQGHSDSPLTEVGINQAKDLAKKLKSVSFDAVFASDLLRAKRTAEIIAQEKKIIIKTTAVLRERSFGRFEGKPREIFQKELQQYWEEYEKLLDEQKSQYKFPTEPDIESDEELMLRFIPFIREIAVAYAEKTVLIVTHGGVMRSFLVHLGYGTPSELSWGTVKNSGYIKLESEGTDFFLKEVTDVEKRQ